MYYRQRRCYNVYVLDNVYVIIHETIHSFHTKFSRFSRTSAKWSSLKRWELSSVVNSKKSAGCKNNDKYFLVAVLFSLWERGITPVRLTVVQHSSSDGEFRPNALYLQLVSEMIYNVPSGTLNTTIPYNTLPPELGDAAPPLWRLPIWLITSFLFIQRCVYVLQKWQGLVCAGLNRVDEYWGPYYVDYTTSQLQHVVLDLTQVQPCQHLSATIFFHRL